MNLPLVTIGIPTYNRYPQLRECLENVMTQTYPNLEILVSDNAADTKVPEWLTELLPENKKLNYVKQPKNLGLLGNHQFLVDHAQGEYFMFLHDDDQIPQNYVQALMEEMLRNPKVTLIGPGCDRYLDGKFWLTYEGLDSRGKSTFDRLDELIPDAFLHHWRYEQYMFGIFKRKDLNIKLSSTFKSQFYFIFLLSGKGEIMHANKITIRKNTTQADIEKYRRAPMYKRYKLLRFFKGNNSKSIQQCFPISLQMIGILVKERDLTLLMKIRLIRKILSYFYSVAVKYEFKDKKKKRVIFH
jgi:glycosyltransferase involved in cell wall biosynthesis